MAHEDLESVAAGIAEFEGKIKEYKNAGGNGIDGDLWDPETDQFIPLHYDAASCDAGKKAACAMCVGVGT